MKRRLYFLLPDTLHVRSVVSDLEASGIDIGALHVVARPGTDLDGLPVATGRQRRDLGERLETALWDGNLGVFFIALVALVVMALAQLAWYWLLIPAAFMLVSFTAGVVFTSHVPNVHLSEFQDAVRHGELLLMVDVPTGDVEQVETLVHRHHPEAVAGGVGWHIDALHI